MKTIIWIGAACVTTILGTLLAVGFAESSATRPANATEMFVGSAAQWAKCRITLDDVQGLFGGTAVVVDGSGECVIRIVDRGLQEKRFKVKLSAEETAALRTAMIDADFVSIKIKDRPGVPDEARPTITVRNADGKEETRAKWANDKVPGFDTVYRALRDLQEKTKGLKPEYEGKYQAH